MSGSDHAIMLFFSRIDRNFTKSILWDNQHKLQFVLTTNNNATNHTAQDTKKKIPKLQNN